MRIFLKYCYESRFLIEFIIVEINEVCRWNAAAYEWRTVSKKICLFINNNNNNNVEQWWHLLNLKINTEVKITRQNQTIRNWELILLLKIHFTKDLYTHFQLNWLHSNLERTFNWVTWLIVTLFETYFICTGKGTGTLVVTNFSLSIELIIEVDCIRLLHST